MMSDKMFRDVYEVYACMLPHRFCMTATFYLTDNYNVVSHTPVNCPITDVMMSTEIWRCA